MVQGNLKKSGSGSLSRTSSRGSTKTGKKRNALGPRPGAKIIKPKKTHLVTKNKLLKKHSGGLTAMTEKNLAEKAGHLEMLRGGKKDRKAMTAAEEGAKMGKKKKLKNA